MASQLGHDCEEVSLYVLNPHPQGTDAYDSALSTLSGEAQVRQVHNSAIPEHMRPCSVTAYPCMKMPVQTVCMYSAIPA